MRATSLRAPLATLALTATLVAASAADKSGVNPNAVSLPAGPGSIQGLGESFEPALNTGTARYSVPLATPPGTAGHAPSLRLAYDGGAGNGPLGIGWDLPIPYVQRQTDKGIPRHIDAPNGLDDDFDGQVDEPDELDTFINDAKEELVPTAGGDYFCENEEAFIRYRRVADHWEATTPAGVRLVFGATENARIADAHTGRVFKWLLEQQIDTRGNVIRYHYAAHEGEANQGQKYLTRIEYGPGAPPWNHFHAIRFEYEDRVDWFEDCRPGFPVRTGRRLREIVVSTQGPAPAGRLQGDFNNDGKPDHLVRRYRLGYRTPANPASIASVLESVEWIGADGVSSLPPARFEYTACEHPEIADARPGWFGAVNDPPVAADNPFVDFIDLNGDALPDLLRTAAHGGPHQAYLNLGSTGAAENPAIRWSPAIEIASADGLAWNANLESESDIAHLADMDGNGLADIVVRTAGGDTRYFANDGSLSWGPRRPMSAVGDAPPSPFGDASARVADIDFDKRADIIQSVDTGFSADYRVWFNRGQEQYSEGKTFPQLEGFNLAQPDTHIADINGDGVPDIARILPLAIRVTAGLGHGAFTPSRTIAIPEGPLDDAHVRQARLQDVTGDGLADLVIERVGPGRLEYWVNLGNYTLSPRRVITGMPTSLGPEPVTRWADMNGNGTTDLVYADSAADPRTLTVDLGIVMGCAPRPNLLTRIENGIGRVTHIAYASSADYALADAAEGRPWPLPLPIPVTVVSSVVTEDSLGHSYTNLFSYHEGYYDSAEKEFRGFARVEQRPLGDDTAPTLVEVTEFHTGSDYEVLKGKWKQRVAAQEDGSVFRTEKAGWTVPPRVLHTGINDARVWFAPQTHLIRTVLELGQGTPREMLTEFDYDNFGNLVRQADYGIVEGTNRSAFNDERVVTTQFATNLAAWILRAPWKREVADEHGHVISRSERFYDDETFSGANPGEVITGKVTLVREWPDPSKPDDFIEKSRSRYDACGNLILTLDPLAVAPQGQVDLSAGHARTIEYDAEFRTYPVRETIHVGNGKAPLVLSAEHDPGFGAAVTAWDFNEVPTRYGYDAFGRLARMIRPGDTEDFPTVEHEYVLAAPLDPGRTVNYIETRALDKAPGSSGDRFDHYHISRQYVDGLGRNVQRKSEAEPESPGGAPRAVVDSATLFNARMGARSTLSPFFTTLSGGLSDVLAFEDIEAPGWKGAFHENGQLAQLGLSEAHQIRSAYDALLRPRVRIYADGSRSETRYEPLITRACDENDSNPQSPQHDTPIVVHRDGLGRHILTEEWVRVADDGQPAPDLRAWITRFEFDLNDRLTRIVDAQGNEKTMRLDGLQRVLEIRDPNAGVIQFEYDDASNRTAAATRRATTAPTGSLPRTTSTKRIRSPTATVTIRFFRSLKPTAPTSPTSTTRRPSPWTWATEPSRLREIRRAASCRSGISQARNTLPTTRAAAWNGSRSVFRRRRRQPPTPMSPISPTIPSIDSQALFTRTTTRSSTPTTTARSSTPSPRPPATPCTPFKATRRPARSNGSFSATGWPQRGPLTRAFACARCEPGQSFQPGPRPELLLRRRVECRVDPRPSLR
jgi:hypothetical protein